MVGAGILSYSLTNESDVNAIDDTSLFSRFSDREDLSRFFESSSSRSNWGYSPESAKFDLSYSGSSREYSKTNVQVEGVDELDSVKTDGRYVYVAGSTGVSVIDAYPPEQLANVTFIPAEDLVPNIDDNANVNVEGIFILPGKLVVITSWYEYSNYYGPVYDFVEPRSMVRGPWSTISVLDVDQPDNPILIWSSGVSGYPISARMTDGTVYMVSSCWAVTMDNDTLVPMKSANGQESEMPLSAIRYDPEMEDADAFTNILALNVSDLEDNVISIVTGYSSTFYASKSAMYLTVPKWNIRWALVENSAEASVDDTTTTSIYKISYEGLSMGATAKGNVKGTLLNQFSMDEYESKLRVATTTDWPDQSNAVYILDSDLNTVGALEDIASGERIYSSRFVGDTLYLVTFRQVDPLFIIDLTWASSPKILSELTLPGFSTYLHPISDDLLLGIGAEDGVAKVSLFDVSDRMNPSEISSWTLSDYKWSSIVWDHKDVLFDSEKGLLVIPVTAYDYDYVSYGSTYVNGAFVFDVTAENGIELRGVIESNSTAYYYGSGVRRSLYIEDCLYTIWGNTIKANLLSDLSEIGSLEFYTSPPWIYRVMA
jgi:inhibitor of cysteine peptidase